MSDSNPHKSSNNNLIEGQFSKISEPVVISEVVNKKVSSRVNEIQSTAAGTSYSNTKKHQESVSIGTGVYASAACEDDFQAHSTDQHFMFDTDFRQSSSSGQSSKYCINEEIRKTLFINTKQDQKTGITSGLSVKYNVDKQIVPSNSKNRSSSNISMFGQLLNKRPNNSAASKSSNGSNTYAESQNSKQESPSHFTRNEVSESSDGLQRAQMKTKLKSLWNNVKYGWRMKREVNLKTDSAIWLLGQCYHNKLNDDLDLSQDVAEQLRLDLFSKIWLTYRINFPVIPGTNIVTDSGWGCMLRCGQMMMAQAFVCHFLQRDWRLNSDDSEDKNHLYKAILRWFGDSMSDNSPFSLHHLVSSGKNYGRKAGDWYGPTHVAHVLRDALNEAKQHHPLLNELCMYVASDGIVFKQDVMDLCLDLTCDKRNDSNTSLNSDFATISLTEIQSNLSSEMLKDSASPDFLGMNLTTKETTNEEPKSFEASCPSYSEFGPPSYSVVKPKWKSLILFVSVRLGNDKMNPFYIPCLKSLLAYEHCIGIIGGRPKHALYFIGWQDDKIIHMDPHSCQPAIDVEKEDFSEKSFHSSSVRMMSFSEMDPSCSIGFYFREFEEFQYFIEKFAEITAPLKRNLEYPVFALAEGKRIEVEDEVDHPYKNRIYPPPFSSPHVDIGDDDDDNDDDYILL